jgi:5'-3' exonuclease
MRLLIDHDILLYRALWGAKDEWYYKQLRVCENLVERIVDDLQPDDYTLIMSGSGNFRYAINPDYKANRKDSPRPRYLYDAKLYFRKYWNAVLSEGCEADDVIGMEHDNENTIVVSSDKDFYQLGGLIYNPVKKEMVDIQNPWYFFYMQMLTGDAADNVEGVLNPDKLHHKVPPHFTETTAKELLAGKSASECKKIVLEMYEITHNDRWFAQFDINARLLFLKRSYADNYNQIF